MYNVDLNIPRSMTLSPTQFENIKPGVSITLKNIPLKNLDDIYQNMGILADGFFNIELANTFAIYKNIKEKKLENYLNELFTEKLENLKNELTTAVNNLNNLMQEKF